MKQIFVLILLLPAFAMAQKNGFTIKGKLTGLADKSGVYLTNPDKEGDTLARAISRKQDFILKGNLPESKLYNISFSPSGKKGLLFIDNDKMELSGNIDEIQQIKLTGSPAHSSFQAFQQRFDPFFRRYSQLSETANKTGVNDSLMTVYKSLVQELGMAADTFATEHKDENIAPFMWATLMQVVDDMVRVERSFEGMAPKVQSSFYGKFLADRIADSKIGRIGAPALDFIQADTAGNQVALSSFKGKYVLVDFWASWCGPCRQENPNVVSAYERFRAKNFTVLGVSLDNNRARWIKAIADDRLNWTHLSDLKYWQNEVAVKYKIQSIPQNLLLDPNGIIIAKNLRGEQLHEKLCELLGCE
ncbi:redoxin domain-containing protein [Flavihumibacter stibioxidans]|uniref:Thioredoxin domain-containing protein n=1 Tax=Flavihumibacter stibioxidans TaxID=1834163 RepID=A0ABR7MB91_9BACT|nr:TlpA disulfide reductase family protein [Flavihumibacter stibioxidans]MBC6492313.1 hypothetical protein [Flavihumibacter stibioxidans]